MTNNIKINFTTDIAKALFYMNEEVVLDHANAIEFKNMIAEMYTHDDNLDIETFQPVLNVEEIVELAMDSSNMVVMDDDELSEHIKDELDTYYGIMSIGEFIDDNSYDEGDIMYRGCDIVSDYRDYIKQEYLNKTDDLIIEDENVYVFHIGDIYSDIRHEVRSRMLTKVAKNEAETCKDEDFDLEDTDLLLAF